MKRALLATALGISLGALSIPASAEPSSKDNSYGYVFTDDALRAETNSSTTPMIKVIKVARRDRLLRPRVHFVTEMLKSVESM